MVGQHYFGVAVMLMIAVATTKAQEWTYIVMSPGELRVGVPYDVTVSILTGGTTNVQLSLKSTKDDSGASLASKSVSVDQGSSKMVELLYTPSGAALGYVYLHVSGSGGNTFTNVTQVKVTQQTSFMMIQTDKGIYKPSTTVQGNVLVADPEVKPKSFKVDITVTDPKGNKIEQWKEKQTNAGGFVSFSFGLSDRPPLGVWIIEAFVSGNRVIMDRVNITVDEYVLPRFEVKIEDVPSYVHAYTPTTLTFTVSAMYTYGEPVVGKAAVTIKSQNSVILSEGLLKDLSKTGKATFSHTISGTGGDHNLKIKAVVTEMKSGEAQSSSSETMVSYKQYPISIKVVRKDQFFMPNSTYHYQVFLNDPVGNSYPVDKLGNDLKLTVNYTTDYFSNPVEEVLQDPLSSNVINVAKYVSGSPVFLKFVINLKTKSTGRAVEMADEGYAGIYVSRSNTRIQLSRVGGDVKVQSGSTVSFKADVPNNIGTIYYVLYSRGMFTGSGAQPTGGQTTATITVQTTKDMSPSSVLIVYGFDGSTGEMLISSKRFSVTGILKNQIQMSFSQSRQKPGSEATITITADPDSTVAIAAVDKSSLLLAKANDITADGVETALDIFDLAMKKMQQNKPMIWNDCNCDAYTTLRLVQLLGVTVMTDAYMHFVPVYDDREIVFDAPVFGVGVEAAIAPGSDVAKSSVVEETSSRVRRYFPETWIWISDSVGPTGRLQIKRTVPDSITSWVATAFGSSPNTGLGIAQKANLEAFQSMFINLRMPYAAIRGESLELKIQVYNYENQKHVANIKLDRSEDFGIWLANENREQVMAKSQDFTASMEIMPNNSNIVSVWIEASKINTITLRVSASFQGTSIADIVERQLLVKPEGQTIYQTKQMLLKLDDKKPMITDQGQVVVPSDFVPDSLFIKTTLMGNIMGAALDGLDKLVRMPFGCGEQNMISLVPNIYVRDYLFATNELTVEIQEKTDKFMKYGVQRELGYRHDDGSFSAFGKTDGSGSTWLTAFVMKSFAQAKKYVYVDPAIIQKASVFLTSHFSSSSGEFTEPGRVIHSEMQGGAANGPALTAYIVISMLEGLTSQEIKGSTAISQAISTLKNNFDREKTTMKPYMLALTAYTLALSGDTKVTEVLQQLESIAKVGNSTKCWGDYCLESDRPIPMAKKMPMDYIITKPKANTVEIASYVLLAYIKVDDIQKAQPILNWLVSQMSDVGGFHSTQDTVLGLQALSTFAAKSTQNLNVNVSVSHGSTVHSFTTVTNNNKNMLQRQQIPSDVRTVDVKAKGSGTVLLTLVWQYNMKKDVSNQQIDLTVKTSPLNDNNRYKLEICSKYVGKEGTKQMAIIKVEVATGFSADIEQTKQDPDIKKVEIETDIVNIYFDDLDELKCASVYANKVDNVGEVQPRSVKTQLYYEPEVQNVVFYQAQTQQVVCNKETCPPGGAGRTSTSLVFCLVCIIAALLM